MYSKKRFEWFYDTRHLSLLPKAKPLYLCDMIYRNGEVEQKWVTADRLFFLLSRLPYFGLVDIDFVEDNHYYEIKKEQLTIGVY